MKTTEKQREYSRNQNKKMREKVLVAYGMKCARCGIIDSRVLQIDHINGGGYEHRKSVGEGSNLYRWIIKNGFPVHFQILCANCNWIKKVENKEHAGLAQLAEAHGREPCC